MQVFCVKKNVPLILGNFLSGEDPNYCQDLLSVVAFCRCKSELIRCSSLKLGDSQPFLCVGLQDLF